jgi:hypothetical protein
MTDPVEKLQRVHRNAPLLLQPRISRVIEAVERVFPEHVRSPQHNKIKVLDTPLNKLQDNADSFLALMRTLPKGHKFKKLVGSITETAEDLKRKLEETGQELGSLLETDEEDLPGIKATALGDLASMVEREGTKLTDIIELTKTLNTLAGKVHKEKKTEPVEHEMPKKEVKPGEEEKGEEAGGPLATEPLPESPGGTAGPPGAASGAGSGLNDLFKT